MDHDALYGAVLTTSPFILLTVSRGIVFGPLPAGGRHRAWKLQRWVLINDLAGALLISAAAVYSMLVLGGVVSSGLAVRNLVVSAGALSVLLVLLHVAYDIVSAHLAEREAGSAPRVDEESNPQRGASRAVAATPPPRPPFA
ncbi:hypothetical protein [Cellulomonas sp. T2.31MG-18]|uniref:hypothetical protein n=1 Tax=Cellulomonas sp. T2.31MG-18 TaxID=3157619 RepID=UPI00366FDCF3